MNKNRLFVHAWGEEGEENHPPVGKDINRPKIPNHSPPCRYDDVQVLGLHVILAWCAW